MPELPYRQFASYLTSLQQGKTHVVPVYLIHGDELLCKTALHDLLDVLVPAEDRNTHYEAYEGLSENLTKVIESLQTYSFFPGIKVIGFLETPLLTEKRDAPKLFAKWQEACARQDTRNVSSYLLQLLSVRSIEMDAPEPIIFDALSDLGMSDEDRSRLSETLATIRNPVLERPSADGVEQLETEIRRGFPQDHHLILTAEAVDRKKSIYLLLAERGVVVDCSMPKDASTKAARQAIEPTLNAAVQRVLADSGKRLSAAARTALLEKTGFDLRTVITELTKLIQFSADRLEISAEDVAAVVSKTKKDPVFEFTNAVLERSLDRALSILTSLLDGDLFPPQILAALHNQLRKMILARNFIDQTGIDMTRMDFDTARVQLVPALMSFEDALNQNYRQWQERMEPPSESRTPKKTATAKASSGSRIKDAELRLLKKGQNPYPVFLLLKRVQAFSMARLIQWMHLLEEADERLKSGPLDTKAVLEYVVISICTNDGAMGNRQKRRA